MLSAGGVEEMQLMQLLTLWIFTAACAAGYSCRVGLWRHWVRGQNRNTETSFYVYLSMKDKENKHLKQLYTL